MPNLKVVKGNEKEQGAHEGNVGMHGTPGPIGIPADVMTYKKMSILRRKFDALLDLRGEKFSYFVVKNIEIMEREHKRFDAMAEKLRPEVTDKMKEYLEREHQLYESFAIPDANGKKFTEAGIWNIDQSKVEELQAAVKEFTKKYKKEADALKNFGKLLEEEENKPIDVTFYRIKKEFIPEEITARLRIPIEFLID